MIDKVNSFVDLKLNSWIVKQCNSIGLKKPTPIQANCIPRILAGEDCIGCAKTGSGKTLAFALPILQKLCEDPYGIFALILTPTRELAFQIADQFSVIGQAINLKKSVIVGGMDMMIQGKELAKHPHIVVATPGRLADHLESCDTFTLKRIKFLVLDEADRLLSGQFDEQIKTIFQALPKQKQSLLFSATITDALDQVQKVSSNKVYMWESKEESGVATVDQLEQHYVLSPKEARDAYLVEVIRMFRSNNENGSIMIFTDTCKNCQLLCMTLNEVGFTNVALHAMIKQRERLSALSKFKSNHVRILIATEVAARGLDIPTVELVINHTVPNIPKEYIHRVGRTARAGRGGMAITIVTPNDIKLIHAIEEIIGTKLTEFKIDDKEVVTIFTQISVTKREAEIKLDETDFYEKKLINKRKKLILEGKDPDEEEEKLMKKIQKHRKPIKKAKLNNIESSSSS
ncbi:probable ATP-dependent RNA helicase DDX49 [Neodiprion virginianus]|uniref:probable ATP-dependent RNA helicase DDX49 n=1 Tax=Neodiprion virginianus TaxID=2961670 RepID=UPI001EE709CE|nr:probable ATP-dependent RNA helicase DDX49 [Neodiprion virginianus]